MSKTFVSYAPLVLKRIEIGAQQAVENACKLGQHNMLTKTFTGMRHGRTYRVPETAHQTYTASAPGEFPASPTAWLRKHIEYQIKTTAKEIVGKLGTPVEYGLFLEKKPPNKGGRPWLKPSYKRDKTAMIAAMRKRWF